MAKILSLVVQNALKFIFFNLGSKSQIFPEKAPRSYQWRESWLSPFPHKPPHVRAFPSNLLPPI